MGTTLRTLDFNEARGTAKRRVPQRSLAPRRRKAFVGKFVRGSRTGERHSKGGRR